MAKDWCLQEWMHITKMVLQSGVYERFKKWPEQYWYTLPLLLGHSKCLSQARNQTTSDLLINLFKGYGAVSDEVFRGWLTRKQDDHEEDTLITPELMLAANNKFDSMIEKGTWNAPTAEEKIFALEACFNKTFKTLKKSSNEDKKIAYKRSENITKSKN